MDPDTGSRMLCCTHRCGKHRNIHALQAVCIQEDLVSCIPTKKSPRNSPRIPIYEVTL